MSELINYTIEPDWDRIHASHVHIAMPCYGGMVTESGMTSLVAWARYAAEHSIKWSLETMIGESLVTRARNILVARYLVDQPQATHLMFIDADIGWHPAHLLALIDAQKPVVGGLYPLKTLPLQWCVNGIPGAQVENNLLEVSRTGTGFLLIERSVFTQLNAHPAVKQFANDIGVDTAYDRELRTYFDTAVRDARYMSEDWEFCERWRELSGKIYIDQRVQLNHTGSLTYSNSINESLMQKYRGV